MDMHDSAAAAQGNGSAVPESLEAVRDILFGAQMRSVETRLQAMEERLLREQQQLRTDLSRRLDELTQSHRELDQRHLRLQEATSLADAEIRDQLLMHASATSTEFARTRQALSADLTAKHQELMTRKTDRVSLAHLLTAMARQLDDPAPNAEPTFDSDARD